MPPDSRSLRALAARGAVRVIAVDVTALAERTRQVHSLEPCAAAMAAQLTAATALLSAHIKGEERLTLQLQAASPPCAWYGEIGEGTFRGRFTPADIPLRGAVKGILVALHHAGGKERYRGTSDIDLETIEAALQRYLASSVQVDAALRLGALCHTDGEVVFAGGVLVEKLPDEPDWPSVSPADFAAMAEAMRAPGVEELVYGVIGGELLDERIEVLQDEPIVWRCTCSRERVEQMLVSLGGNEMRAILEGTGQAEVTCHFCNRVEVVPRERLQDMLARLVEA